VRLSCVPCVSVFFLLRTRRPPGPTLFPYTTLFRSAGGGRGGLTRGRRGRRPPLPRPATGVYLSPVWPRTYAGNPRPSRMSTVTRSEEHTSELQSRENLVCRLLLEKKKRQKNRRTQS